jgi:murein L,D-transpeptidase YafK
MEDGSCVADAVEHNDCETLGTSVLIDTKGRQLSLCLDGLTVERFPVGLGEEGVGKTKQGDLKTPIGTYRLGRPRKSGRGFNLFIPVKYPTSRQRKQGYTGGAIGVHGPQRDFAEWPEGTYGTQDWTEGCIAVGSDEEIERISSWVKDHKVRDVHITE